MKVCIAEKPSVAKEIARVLGATSRGDGYFEGNGYAVTYTFGHLCTLKEPIDYKSYWKKWDLNNLPMLPDKFGIKLSDDSGIKKQFGVIRSLFGKATEVINCGDAGQEGELIQRWVLQEAGYKGPVKRLWISSLTEEAIKEGFNHLEDASKYDSLYYAGYSRAIGDWLLGINGTRLFSLRYGQPGQVLSIGRVQTPTLAMVVERYQKILNFKPTPYWELQTTYRSTVFKYDKGRFDSKEEGASLAKLLEDQPLTIDQVNKKNGKEYAPKLFDLTGLQVYCNKRFSLTAERTLAIAQKLYEQKLITYPRVDTTFLPDDIYPKCQSILKGLTKYSSLTQDLFSKPLKKSTRVFNNKKVSDHHAIIPTGEEQLLSAEMKQVYDVICKRFIAIFYDDCLVSHTHVIASILDYEFKASGKEIISAGWRSVIDESKPEDNQQLLPGFVAGESGTHLLDFLEKQTKAPSQYTEASLLRSMETAGKDIDDDELRDAMKANGIGRPSTRASIIETLFRRKYIERKKKLILPTPMGVALIEVIHNKLLKSPELTGSWEKKLREIESGDYAASSFISQMKQMVDHLVYEVRSGTNVKLNLVQDQTPDQRSAKTKPRLVGQPCVKCQEGNLLKGSSAYGCSNYAKGCDFTLPFIFMGKKISENQYLRLIEKKSTVNLKGFNVDDKKVEGKLMLNAQLVIELQVKEPRTVESSNSLPSCPKCQKGTVLKGKTAYGCSNYKQGCDFVYSFDKLRSAAQGRPLTRDLVLDLLKKGAQ